MIFAFSVHSYFDVEMDNGNLSEEQRLRIEENKRRALAKRQQAQSTQQTVQKTSSSSSGAVPSRPHGFTNNTKTVQGNPLKRLHPSSSSTSGSEAGPQTSHTASKQKQNTGTGTWLNKRDKSNGAQHTAGITKNKFYGAVVKPLKGQCILISRDRFEVNIGFNQAIVEVFKSIKSKVYDAPNRKWNFDIGDHDALLSAARSLQPTVQVEPLPRAVLQIFGSKTGTEKTDKTFIPQADLSQVDSVLVDSLLPFQREGVNFGVHLNGRVLIADDMGLGKTLQAICLACIYRAKWPLLVVTPSSVRFDWAQQFKRWVPSLDPERINVAVTGRDNPAGGLVNIISYDLLSRKVKELTAAKFRVIITDESHFLKSSKTVRTKAALPLLQSAQHVVLLSGTPALSRPAELYTQIVAVRPHMFKFHDFGLRYCEGKQNPWGWDYSGACNLGELQLLMEEKIMIRRMKQDVLSQLPSKRRQIVVLDPAVVASSQALVKASKLMEKKLSGMERRGALLQYFHETCRVKQSAVRSYVLDMVAAEKKFIIFAHHQEMLDSIEDAVASENIQYIRIDGKTTAEQRHFFCKKFQTKEKCKVAVLSITAANAGLNLAAASIVVFAELFWNPGILVQAEDRAHRLGQQDSVLVYYLVAQKTADDIIWPLVQNKLQVLGKAGLAKDDFANTDTAHVQDPRQKSILDILEESFQEENEGQGQTSDARGNEDALREALPTTPRKRTPTGSPSKKRKLTPLKGQMGIGQFFSVDTIVTSRSPQKAGTAQDTGSSSSPEGQRYDSNDQGSSGDQQEAPQGHEDVRVGGVDIPDWDDEMGEEAMAALADVDWDEDFDEPEVKKMKT